jgi:hypothetical protein
MASCANLVDVIDGAIKLMLVVQDYFSHFKTAQEELHLFHAQNISKHLQYLVAVMDAACQELDIPEEHLTPLLSRRFSVLSQDNQQIRTKVRVSEQKNPVTEPPPIDV